MPGPFFATMGLAVPALMEAGTEAQKKEVLGAIAAGSARATLALTEPSGRWDAGAVTLAAKPSGGGGGREGGQTLLAGGPAGAAKWVWRRARAAGEERGILSLAASQ